MHWWDKWANLGTSHEAKSNQGSQSQIPWFPDKPFCTRLQQQRAETKGDSESSSAITSKWWKHTRIVSKVHGKWSCKNKFASIIWNPSTVLFCFLFFSCCGFFGFFGGSIIRMCIMLVYKISESMPHCFHSTRWRSLCISHSRGFPVPDSREMHRSTCGSLWCGSPAAGRSGPLSPQKSFRPQWSRGRKTTPASLLENREGQTIAPSVATRWWNPAGRCALAPAGSAPLPELAGGQALCTALRPSRGLAWLWCPPGYSWKEYWV